MRRSKFYNMRLPERGAREGEANDAADIEDLTYDLEIIDKEMERQRLEDVRMEKEKATKLELSQHKSAAVLDHPDNSVTDAKLGQRTVLTTSGPLQTLLTAIGNAIKAISGADTWNGTPATTLKDAKTHMGDAVKHITAQERESWNTAATDRHSHTNKSVLDGITAAMVTAWNTVSSKLPLAGGTLTGFLTLHAAPATDMHAATKKYVDDKMAASGSGDMTKAVYDPGGRELPYIPKQDVDALAWGGDFGASGTPVSIAYAGAQRIASITAYGENAQGGTTEAPVALTGISSVTVNDDVTELPIPRPLRRVGDVKDKCVTRQDYESAEKLVVTYNVGFVELDGTEASHLYEGMFYLDFSHVWPTPANRVNGVCSHYPYGAYGKGKIGLTDNGAAVVYNPNGDYTGDEGGLANWKAYLAAQKEAGTPVQVAYQLATPETYATDPLDIDNAAGPLTVMTGGEVEVRMTELVGSRSPELTAKMDKAVYTQVGNPSELDNDNFLHCVNQRNVSGTISAAGYFIDRWKLISGTVQITENGLVLNGTMSQILENAAGTDVTASASAGAASYDNSTKTFTLTATGQTVTWAKLEKGSVATPYVPKGYGAELAECQRYFKRVGNRGFRGWATNETNVVCCLTLATQMRVKPTITPVGTLTAYDEVSGVTVTMDSSTGSTVDTARITAHGTGLTAFRTYSLLGNVDISADL